jgi:4-alpha-glucanotransferase
VAALKAYANGKGVQIIGDTPIFIAYLSAEVWANQHLFELDAHGRPTVVAGVPPDFFSATGQRWGNPLYRWSRARQDGYAWWVERVRRTFELVDIVRIDHFRGFAGYWEIPASEPTAMKGRWVPGPGEALFKAIQGAGPMPIIAEDLGVITPDVDALRKKFAFPGMRILQFAFNGDASDRFLPHNHEPDTVVYTGTHDNDTVAGWWATASDHERHFARGYLATDGHDMPWTLIRAAWPAWPTPRAPDAGRAGPAHRVPHELPRPGKRLVGWRFQWSQVQPWHAAAAGRAGAAVRPRRRADGRELRPQQGALHGAGARELRLRGQFRLLDYRPSKAARNWSPRSPSSSKARRSRPAWPRASADASPEVRTPRPAVAASPPK